MAERKRTGSPGQADGRLLAGGDGWSVRDIVCSSGPDDRPFEEQHSGVSIAMVVAGTFQYRSAAGRALLTPGSLLLGNAGQAFECAHEHGAGDRCISFQYAPEYFEGAVEAKPLFRGVYVPPTRVFSPLVARACAGLIGRAPVAWQDLAIEVAARAIDAMAGPRAREASPAAVARVSRVIRAIERHSAAAIDLDCLARETGLSRYHFIRTFERVTGVTPYQFLLRVRLREAALRLATTSRIIDTALDCGFGDVSNFNRTFRAEFGANPRAWHDSIGES